MAIAKQFPGESEKPEYQPPRGLMIGTNLIAGVFHRAEQGLFQSRSRVECLNAFSDEPTHLSQPGAAMRWVIRLPGGAGSLISQKQGERMLE
jgi:hypothetical protein